MTSERWSKNPRPTGWPPIIFLGWTLYFKHFLKMYWVKGWPFVVIHTVLLYNKRLFFFFFPSQKNPDVFNWPSVNFLVFTHFMHVNINSLLVFLYKWRHNPCRQMIAFNPSKTNIGNQKRCSQDFKRFYSALVLVVNKWESSQNISLSLLVFSHSLIKWNGLLCVQFNFILTSFCI